MKGQFAKLKMLTKLYSKKSSTDIYSNEFLSNLDLLLGLKVISKTTHRKNTLLIRYWSK